MSRSAYCLQQAQICTTNAQRSRDSEGHQAWLGMAAQWERLARAVADEDNEKPARVVLQQQQIQPK